MVVALGLTISEPESAFAPLQPFDAVHDVTLLEVQANTEVAPLEMVDGVAVSVSVGVGCTGLQRAGSMSARARRDPSALWRAHRRSFNCCVMLVSRDEAADALENEPSTAKTTNESTSTNREALTLFPIRRRVATHDPPFVRYS